MKLMGLIESDLATRCLINPADISSVIRDGDMVHITMHGGRQLLSCETLEQFEFRLANLWNLNAVADTPTVELDPPAAAKCDGEHGLPHCNDPRCYMPL